MGYFESVAVWLCLEWLGPFVYDDLVCKIVCRFGILCPKIFGYYFHFVGLELFVYCNTFRLVHTHKHAAVGFVIVDNVFNKIVGRFKFTLLSKWVYLLLFLDGLFFSSRSFRVEREREREKEIIKAKIFSAVWLTLTTVLNFEIFIVIAEIHAAFCAARSFTRPLSSYRSCRHR